MSTGEREQAERLAEAAGEFDRHEKRKDGVSVASSLAGGLTVLRDSVYSRLHHDVERVLGEDSVLTPISEVKTLQLARKEIEVYQIAESAAIVEQLGFVSAPDDWYLRWLTRFRLGESGNETAVIETLRAYLSKTVDDRRLAFTDVMAKVLPESRRAPLVLFRLAPLSVQIATALAFGDDRTARRARRRQAADLPAIDYCQQCRGNVLASGEQCRTCGNPLWKYAWLTATD